MTDDIITIDGKRYRKVLATVGFGIDYNFIYLHVDRWFYKLIPLEENMSKCSKCEFLEIHPLQGLKTCKEHTTMEEDLLIREYNKGYGAGIAAQAAYEAEKTQQLTAEQQIRISALNASLQAFSIDSGNLINNGLKVTSLAARYAKFITDGEIFK